MTKSRTNIRHEIFVRVVGYSAMDRTRSEDTGEELEINQWLSHAERNGTSFKTPSFRILSGTQTKQQTRDGMVTINFGAVTNVYLAEVCCF
jgi:hypothetical protein